ncbi:MAG: CHAT domain-containing protein [Elusimicrobia bacterium]|nr:CHAT domain-containing protein [Elusimicrobiota bacterium]
MGKVLRVYGDYEASLQALRQAMSLHLSTGGAPLDVLLTMQELTDLNWDLGDYEEGVAISSEALVLARKTQNRLIETVALNNLGGALLYAGDADEALSFFQEVDQLDPNLQVVAANMGRAYLSLGDAARAAEIFTGTKSFFDLARARIAQGRFAEACRLYSEEFKKWEMMGQREIFLTYEIGMGLCSEGMGNKDGALTHYQKAIGILERIRDANVLNMRLGLMNASSGLLKHLEPFEGLIRLSTAGSGGWSESFIRSEFTHGRTFTEAIGRRRGSLRHLLPAPLSDEDGRLGEEVAIIARETNRAYFRNDWKEAAGLQSKLDALKRRHEALMAKLRAEYPRYGWAKYPAPIEASAIPLRPHEVLIEYEVMERVTRVFVVRADCALHVLDLPVTRAAVSSAVLRYLGSFTRATGISELASFDPRAGHELYKMILKPVLTGTDNQSRPLVVDADKVIIVPDEVLGILPFESLVTSVPESLQMPSGPHGPVPVGVGYVADDYDIAYYQSATALATQRTVPRQGRAAAGMLVLADPVFDPSDSRLSGTSLVGARPSADEVKTMGAVVKAMGLGGSRKGQAESKVIGPDPVSILPRLDKTSVLAQDLRQKLFAADRVVTLVGTSASKSELLKQDLRSFRYIVLATHGLLGRAIPGIREPALALSQVGNKELGEGFLTMSDVMGLDLNADVVALTACQTGLGRRVSGEGVVGLGRAFLQAGARNALVSLWNVSEESTVLLTERFFLHVRDGQTPHEALRSARTDIRREGFEHPYYWAPFVLFSE